MSQTPYLSLFPITLSHPHLQSVPPNLVNWGWEQSICRKFLLSMRPFSETIFHSTMIDVLSSFRDKGSISIFSLFFVPWLPLLSRRRSFSISV
jgi:hypothetical protein